MLLFICALLFSHNSKIDKYKDAVLCIEGRTAVAEIKLGRFSGTGFIIDKKKGFVITNQHIARGHTLTSLELITSKGKRRMEAKHIYSHPFLDFAIIKFDPKDLKDEVNELKINTKLPTMNEPVIIVSNSEMNNFSIHDGQISNLYESTGFFPLQSIRISVIARGGASGSPVINKKGEVIGIVFAGSTTSLWAIPIVYIKDILDKIEKKETIQVADPGFSTNYISIDDAIKNYNLPEKPYTDYEKKFPHSFNRVLMATQIKSSSVKEDQICPGDIIYTVNDQVIGPSHYLFSKLMNDDLTKGKPSQIEIWRNGKLLKLKIKAKNAFQVDRYLKFGGATICPSNEMLNKIFNIKTQIPLITSIEPGSMMHNLFEPIGASDTYAIVITHINNKPITDMNSLEKTLKELVQSKKEDFFITYRNFGAFIGFDQIPILNRLPTTQYLSFKTPKDKVIEKYTLSTHEDGNEWKIDLIEG